MWLTSVSERICIFKLGKLVCSRLIIFVTVKLLDLCLDWFINEFAFFVLIIFIFTFIIRFVEYRSTGSVFLFARPHLLLDDDMLIFFSNCVHFPLRWKFVQGFRQNPWTPTKWLFNQPACWCFIFQSCTLRSFLLLVKFYLFLTWLCEGKLLDGSTCFAKETFFLLVYICLYVYKHVAFVKVGLWSPW